MDKETKITLPEEFLQMCDFMDVSPVVFLEKFACNILCYKDVDDPDGAFLEGTGNLLLKGKPRLKSFVMPNCI